MAEKLTVQDGQVVSLAYTLHVDGEVIDESQENDPLEYIQGEGMIIPGLEEALYDLGVGESKSVIVAPENGYGEVDSKAFMVVPKSQFPSTIPLTAGTELHVRNDHGEEMDARIDSVSATDVRLDFNHPLAGKELYFDVKVVALRPASEEELSHGHVHGDEHDHHHGNQHSG